VQRFAVAYFGTKCGFLVAVGEMGGAEGALGDESSHWVTVFGFPRSEAAQVIGFFHQFGDIVSVRQSQSNWLCLRSLVGYLSLSFIHSVASYASFRYQTPLQAQQALSKNGRIFGNMMLGVLPGVAAPLV